jgi:hypothetical protein
VFKTLKLSFFFKKLLATPFFLSKKILFCILGALKNNYEKTFTTSGP